MLQLLGDHSDLFERSADARPQQVPVCDSCMLLKIFGVELKRFLPEQLTLARKHSREQRIVELVGLLLDASSEAVMAK